MTALGYPDRHDPRTRLRLGPLPYVVGGCMFMENLDATVIITALPTMARDFDVTTTALSLGISVYLVALAVCLPLSPWLSQRFGSRTVVAGAITAFALASLMCAFSATLPAFVAARALQGAAAGLMSPAGRLAVLRDAPKDRLLHVIAVFTWPALIAPLIGPPIGGLLTSFASWHWIFILNLPFGVIGVWLALRFVPQYRAPPSLFDTVGFLLTAGTLSLLVLGLELASGAGERATGAVMITVGAVAAFVTIRHLRRATHPLVDLASFGTRTFSVTTLSGGNLSRITVNATPFLLPLLFQSVFGFSAAAAGAMMIAYFAGNLAMKTVTTQLLRRLGFRTILIGNGAALAILTGLIGAAALGPPLLAFVALLLVAGASRSLQFTALNTLTYADVPPPQQGHALTLNALAQQISAMLGVALSASLLNVALAARGGGSLAAGDFLIAFAVLAAIAACAVISFARLHPDAGDTISGARPASRRSA